MDINQPTLIQFENNRKQINLIPPLESNSFYTIGTGEINMFCLRNSPTNYRFDLSINKGTVFTGMGNFYIAGDINNTDNPYRNLDITVNSKLSVTQGLTISGGEFNIYGTLELMEHSRLFARKDSTVIFNTSSFLNINRNSGILAEDGCILKIYGTININISELDSIIKNPNIIIDSAAILNVTGISFDNKEYSLVQYNEELQLKDINVNTQGEKNYDDGKNRIGYTWKDGKPLKHTYSIDINILFGETVLGDLRFAITGFANNLHDGLKNNSNLYVKHGTTLYITDKYNDSTFIRPELYIGVIIDNSKSPGSCVVNGKIICDGDTSMINIDRGASLHIEEGGEVHLRNNAIIRSTYNENKQVLFINGTLIIDDISQINTLEENNIVLGNNGKVIIMNPDTGKKRILFSTPDGITKSDLYRLFIKNIDHIEYHVSNNTGIVIDKYYDFYARDMKKWFGDRRFEKAIKDGILIWHDGGFIQLDHKIIPWAELNSNLYHASRLFKTFGSYDNEKLQDAVNRLNYAGCGNIVFRFVDGDNSKEITLDIKSIHMLNVFNNPLEGKYIVHTDNDGLLFLKNKVPNTKSDTIMNKDSKVVNITDNKGSFTL